MSILRKLFLFSLIMSLAPFSASLVNAATVGSYANAGMEMNSSGEPFVVYASDENGSSSSGSVNVSYAPWQANAYSTFTVDNLSNYGAEINYEVGLGMLGSGYGSIGDKYYKSNRAMIHYHADADSIMTYEYTLDFFGEDAPEIYAGSLINITARINSDFSNTYSSAQTWVGIDWDGIWKDLSYRGTHFEGTGTYQLNAGEDYTFMVSTQVGCSGTITPVILGELDYSVGWVSFNFDPTAVPIPGAVWLLGSGLIGLVGLRRKVKK